MRRRRFSECENIVQKEEKWLFRHLEGSRICSPATCGNQPHTINTLNLFRPLWNRGAGTAKIAKISTTVVNARMRNWIFVKVETDQPGLYGWSEATLEWKMSSIPHLKMEMTNVDRSINPFQA